MTSLTCYTAPSCRRLSSSFDPVEECAFDPSRLNFAIHVRLGDRTKIQGIDAEYYELLDLFMDTVTSAVLAKGLSPPLFHIFSETSQPCPPADSRIFEEFSMWPPVDPYEVRLRWGRRAKSAAPTPYAGRRFASPCLEYTNGVVRDMFRNMWGSPHRRAFLKTWSSLGRFCVPPWGYLPRSRVKTIEANT